MRIIDKTGDKIYDKVQDIQEAIGPAAFGKINFPFSGVTGPPTEGLLLYAKSVQDTIGDSTISDLSGNSNDISVYTYCPTLAGTETLTLAHLTGSETVTTSYGTSTPTVGSGQITFSAGTIQYILLSDGSELIFEGANGSTNDTIYNADGTGRHGTFASAVTFDTAINSSYLAKYGGSVDIPNGIELSAAINGSTGANQLLNLGDNTFRWVGDGSTFTYIRFISPELGETYRIIPTVISHSSGSIKGNDATDSDLFSAFSSTPDPIDDVITTKIEFGRAVGGQAIDITVQFSVQKIVDGPLPAERGTSVDVAGNDLTFSGPFESGFPGYVKFPADAALIAADNLLTSSFLYTAGTPNEITPTDLLAFTGGSLENVMFMTPERGFLVYSSRQNIATAGKALRYLRADADLKIGIFSDNHYASDVTTNTEWMVGELTTQGVHAIISTGDNYEASLDGGWTTLGDMQAEISSFEALFSAWDNRNLSFSTGNHTYPTYGTFSDFWAESTIVTENSVKVFRDVAVINIMNANSPSYTADSTALTFLSTEIENARQRGNRIIIHMHIPVNQTTNFLQASDVVSAISTGQGNGVEFLAVLTGHVHEYQESTVPSTTPVPHYRLDGLRDLKIAYLMTVTDSGFTLDSLTE